MTAAAANPIDAPGTSEAAWAGQQELARLEDLDLAGWTSAVILAAHPDDEVLGAGGIISLLAGAGCRIRVIAVTDGEASHPGQGNPAGLASLRASERAAALRALGAGDAEVLRLGLPDAALDGRADEIAALLAGQVAGFEVCLAPWEHDIHADHEAVGHAARQVAGRVFFYPVWMWHWARPADPRVRWTEAVRVRLRSAAADRKRAAIRCFRSQLKARAGAAGPVLTEDFVAHFTRDYEVLFPVTLP